MKTENFEKYRGRLNFYGGLALGALVPIVLTRCSYGNIGHDGNIAMECAKEAGLLVRATLESIPWYFLSMPAGLALGVVSSMQLANRKPKRTLESI